MRRSYRAVTLLALVALVAAGCGKKPSSASSGGGGTTAK